MGTYAYAVEDALNEKRLFLYKLHASFSLL